MYQPCQEVCKDLETQDSSMIQTTQPWIRNQRSAEKNLQCFKKTTMSIFIL